jgi:proteasome beta subunit
MDAEFKPNMSEEKVRELATRAIRSAIARDTASGDGIDILYITRTGYREEAIKPS